MPDACPVDLNLPYCVLHYEPELLLLACLVIVCMVLALKSTDR